MKNKKLIIFGDSAFAEIAYEYFTYDSEYEVCAFTIDKEFINQETLFGLPIIPFENIEQKYNPEEYEMHIALVYNKLNRIRMEKYNSAKQKGYTLSNYVSSKSFVWKNVELGDNVFIFEDNTIQPFVKLGSNIVLWSGNHIGHHSTIDDHNFISSHVVISGYVGIGESCFIGVNSTVNNNIVINKDTFIGSGSLITKNIKKGSFVYGNRSEIADVTSYKKFKIDELD